MRTAHITRDTAETKIDLRLALDGAGDADIASGVGFMDHMLTLFTRHGGFDLTLRCQGDTEVDDHHSTEDIGIALGQAFHEALGDRRGIRRYGSVCLPMDETLVQAAVDISGRGGYYGQLPIPTQKVGTFDTELVQEFMTAFARNAGITLHIRLLAGENSHHIIEGAFKALARALGAAAGMDPDHPDRIPSTKGIL